MSAQHFTSATCPTCQTGFDRLPLERDEDGGYAVLPVTPCAQENCGTLLCPCCAQFHCDGCGMTFCADHLISVPDATETPLHCCPTCAAECEPSPSPFPPARERRTAATAGAEIAALLWNLATDMNAARVRKIRGNVADLEVA